MKLIRHGEYNEEFFSSGGLQHLVLMAEKHKATLPKVSDGERLGSPIARPSKIVCIGLNYADHAKETGAVPLPEPVIFLKSTTALCGPFDEIMIPKNSVKTDLGEEI